MTKKGPFPYALDLLSNYIIDTGDLGAGNDKWTSTTVQTYTVPADKRWLLLGGHVKRDTATGTATLAVTLHNASDQHLVTLASAADGTTEVAYPAVASVGRLATPFTMDTGWYVKITIGEAQGAAATASCIVHEFTHAV